MPHALLSLIIMPWLMRSIADGRIIHHGSTIHVMVVGLKTGVEWGVKELKFGEIRS